MSTDKKNFNNEKLSYSLTYEDMVQILKLVDDYQFRNLNIELGDLKLKVDKKGVSNRNTNEDMQTNFPSTLNEKEQADKDTPKEETAELSDHSEENINEAETITDEKEMDGTVSVQASITGVFYRSPSPGEEPYVTVGSEVKKGDEVGLVEVMKLFNTINAPCDGVIKEILVEDESVVNVEDILMIIEPK